MLLPLLLMATMGMEQPETKPATAPAPVEEETLAQLLTVRRVYIDRLSGGETAGQMRDMIAASLQNARLFVITENPDRADAILRGSAEDLVFTDIHSSSDSIHADAHFGYSDGDSTYNNSGGYGVGGHSSSTQRDQRSRNGGMSVGDSESTHSVERKHEAVAAVRLVSKDGDVIWSTTQESLGGKFRGSSADVADKITKKLLEDYERARKLQK
ncbi:MAG TPA: hypothetical protein VMT32_01790 [Bryobacteraceae bacterium]|nr:hypothetical protein [Bryobacteraceae bacterium]